MSDNQARFSPGVYDDLEGEGEARTRRRRPVADWGVGDDVFEHMPRRRFTHASDGPARDRRPPARDVPAAEPEPEREIPRGRVEDGRRTLRIGSDEDVPSEIEAVTADRDLGLGEEESPESPAAAGARPYVEPGSRRTVKIGGHPEGAGFYQGPQRRRPPRRAHERIGHRPDRIAMWAFALGLLLILIAVLTAH